MNTTKSEKAVKELLLNKTWEYLNENFHKFTETNKIKIALALCTKNLPTEIQGNVELTHFFEQVIARPMPERVNIN